MKLLRYVKVKWIKNGTFEPNPSSCVHQTVTINPVHGFTEQSTPLEILRAILTDEIVDSIVLESNRFVAQVKSSNPKAFTDWIPLTSNEFMNFWALNLLMGIVQKPCIKDYWSTNELLSTPIFGKTMSRNRLFWSKTILRYPKT